MNARERGEAGTWSRRGEADFGAVHRQDFEGSCRLRSSYRGWRALTLLALVSTACGATSENEPRPGGRTVFNDEACDGGSCGGEATRDDRDEPCPELDALASRQAPPAPRSLLTLPPPTGAAGPVAPAPQGVPANPAPSTLVQPVPSMAPVPLEVCGDARVTPPEECDDGNNSLGDGCDPLCGLESGFVCPNPGAPCVSTVVCGDGVLSPGEICDDANVSSNDGCSGDCQSIELGFRCQPGRPCTSVCGDGMVSGAEQCDDGNGSAIDGCSATCRPEPGFVCPNDARFRALRQSDSAAPSNVGGAPGVPATPVAPATVPIVPATSVPGAEAPTPSTPDPTLPLPEAVVTCRPSVCGDGVVEGGEGCDDGNLESSDGCRPDCVLEPYCAVPNDCVTVCGDGLLLMDGDEACDDGNSFTGDGCDSSCRLEPGFQCELVVDTWPDAMPNIYLESRGHSECAALCGDGLVVGDEECDDGAMNGAGYGYCAADCSEGPRCGDGQVDADQEQCDNGVNSAPYYIEESSCAPGCVLPAFCGDGITDPTFGEECDRGAESNIGEYGGCSPVCELTGTCGNGVVESASGEQCDDGNQNRGDGCDSSCRAETPATGGGPSVTPDDVFVPPVNSPPTETEAPQNPCK